MTLTSKDLTPPFPLQFNGSKLARGLLRLWGWRDDFQGLPGPRGVLIAYPHTSNWDFLVGILTKWAIGLEVKFWAKDSLFRLPLIGTWMRWVGGVPVDRSGANGMVGSVVKQMQQAPYFWLALAPEGTRSLTAGWRSGFYRVAVQGAVPLGMVYIDYAHKRCGVTQFIWPSGNEDQDMQRIASIYADRIGCRPQLASPIQLIATSKSEPGESAP